VVVVVVSWLWQRYGLPYWKRGLEAWKTWVSGESNQEQAADNEVQREREKQEKERRNRRRWWPAALVITFVICFVFFLLPVAFARWVGGLSDHTITSWGDGFMAAFILAVVQVVWIIPLLLIYRSRRKPEGKGKSINEKAMRIKEVEVAIERIDDRLVKLGGIIDAVRDEPGPPSREDYEKMTKDEKMRVNAAQQIKNEWAEKGPRFKEALERERRELVEKHQALIAQSA